MAKPEKSLKPAKPSVDQYERFTPKSRAEWRQWLQDNGTSAPGVWLIYYKKHTGQPTVTYDEAVEEALCYGWIDSVAYSIDGDSHRQLFTPRKAGSGWSRTNKVRIEALLEHGLMAEPGLQKIEAAKQDGSWTLLDAIEDLLIPDDLREALTALPPALENFEVFNKSSKKIILLWIASTKRPETRAKRIAETAALAAQNKRAQVDR